MAAKQRERAQRRLQMLESLLHTVPIAIVQFVDFVSDVLVLWQFAQAENFMFTLPVDVAWESLDSGAISRLFVRHPHLGLQAAQLARRVLVARRGAHHLRLITWSSIDDGAYPRQVDHGQLGVDAHRGRRVVALALIHI